MDKLPLKPASSYEFRGTPGTPEGEKEWDDIAAALALELKDHIKSACLESPATLADYSLFLHEAIAVYKTLAEQGVDSRTAAQSIALRLMSLATPPPTAKRRMKNLGI